jgi:hypothetical protein
MGFHYVEHQPEQFNIQLRDKSKPVGNRPVMIPAIMRACMLAPFEAFAHLGTLGQSDKGALHEGRHIYIDRGSKVLGVAHLDSVQKPDYFWSNRQHVVCPTLDNRLGVWVLLHGLPSIGIYPDVLLTENEEKGASTAFDFRPSDPRWNWMFSFDRGVVGSNKGTDVVLYQYDGGELEKALKKSDFTVGIGSYSCIAELDHLGIEGVNVGCTMTDYHSSKAYADIAKLSEQLSKFAAFYTANEQTKYEYKAKQWSRKRGKRSTTSYYHNGSWSASDYAYGDHYYGTQRTLSPGQKQTHFTRINNAVARLRREGETIAIIGREGWDMYLDGCQSFEQWRELAVIPEGVETKAVPHHCRRCEGKYSFADVTYSHFFGCNYCKGCYLEIMEVMKLLPEDWRDDLVNVPLQRLLTDAQGDDYAPGT